MAFPTVISKIIDTTGQTLTITFSTPMASGADAFTMTGYVLSGGVINGAEISWTVSPSVEAGPDLIGVLTPSGTINSTTGDPLFQWPADSSPEGDVDNQSEYVAEVLVQTMPTYNTLAEAKVIATGLHGMTAWAAASDGEMLAALQTASMRVDASRRWQGRKYNLDEDGETIEQEKEFPRVDGRWLMDSNPDDLTSGVPIVPRVIKIAEVLEANSLLDGQRADRVAAQHDGLASQSIGTSAESYRPATNAQGLPVLCAEADMLCRRYQLRSGALL